MAFARSTCSRPALRLTLVTGDSGGGWSWNFTAYGAHYGNCGSNDMFSVADLFDEAIGVSVLTQ